MWFTEMRENADGKSQEGENAWYLWFWTCYFEMSWLYIQVKGSSKQMWGGGKEGGEKEGRGQCIDGRVSPWDEIE